MVGKGDHASPIIYLERFSECKPIIQIMRDIKNTHNRFVRHVHKNFEKEDIPINQHRQIPLVVSKLEELIRWLIYDSKYNQ